MDKLNLGLDLDGVVANWNKGFRRVFLEREDVPEPLSVEALRLLDDESAITTWDFVQDVVGLKNWEWFWSAAVPTGRVFARLPAYRAAINQTLDLIQRHNVFVLTTRPSSIRDETYEWIGHYHLQPKAVIHVDHKVGRGFGGGQDKVTMINALGLDAMLEDNADTALAIANHTSALSYLLDRPWNLHLSECRRVPTIAEYERQVVGVYS